MDQNQLDFSINSSQQKVDIASQQPKIQSLEF